MKRELKGCIFDLDGVIVDTAEYHYQSWQKLAEDLDFEFTKKDNEQLKGISRMASLEIVLKKGGVFVSEEEKLEMCAHKNDLYIDYINNLSYKEVLPGIGEILTDLRKNGIKVALGSASKNARMVLEKLDITHLFDAIVDGTDVRKSKPDPEVFLKGAAEMKLFPEECVVFEDAEKGLIAAKTGHFKCIGIGTDPGLAIADLQIATTENFTFKDLQNFWLQN